MAYRFNQRAANMHHRVCRGARNGSRDRHGVRWREPRSVDEGINKMGLTLSGRAGQDASRVRSRRQTARCLSLACEIPRTVRKHRRPTEFTFHEVDNFFTGNPDPKATPFQNTAAARIMGNFVGVGHTRLPYP